ncbi:energy-coupling factor ABC transporter ATP-binding protein [Calothrix sp. NIES-3974]|uniref:energy-coupling factor ABC transporter ATP-binding protein n=1 Tax=Calothrix sp. NIES-3974 TaxID=2005462 RepID=UPI000BBB92B3|nr:ABC transporter ATP-binding protein [Calothrix sp. NIES-3974]
MSWIILICLEILYVQFRCRTLLDFNHVSYKYFGSKQITINQLTLQVPAGKKCALIGQNGCGKTTLFLLANGLYKPLSGQIKWRGQPFAYTHYYLNHLRQKIGLVFQDPEHQLVASTVAEDISYGLCNLNLPLQEIKTRVEKALIDFELTELADTPIHHLSLGQKKRVSIADVMVLQPELLILDEPTAYLDIKHTRQLLSVLAKIHQSGTTLLMATHDLNLVYNWADWIFVMDQGQLILEGEPNYIFSQTQTLTDLELDIPLLAKIQGLSPTDLEIEPAILAQIKDKILQLAKKT